ncbi:MAG: DUF2231 domain-containing protein [Actinobacteria bacterium]|nr:DUF2231 domain-containing protein [Actinomycetota bacterium]
MRKFSFKPTLTMKGRKFKGVRGFAGKPTHPPLTDIPIGAVVLVLILDVASAIGGHGASWAHGFYTAGTVVLLAGAIGAVLAAVTGWIDAWTSSEAGTQARRTINAHALLMIIAVVLAAANLIVRFFVDPGAAATPIGVLVLSILMVLVGAVGATFGGAMVFEYGFNVETAGDHPVWSKSEEDVFHGEH